MANQIGIIVHAAFINQPLIQSYIKIKLTITMTQNIEAYLQKISELQESIDQIQKDLTQSQSQSQLHLQRVNQLQTQIQSKNQ